MSTDLLQMALAVFGGQLSPAWEARANRARSLLSAVIGRAPPDIPLLPPEMVEPGAYPRLTPTNTRRPAALDAAEDLIDAIARRRFARLHELLHEEVWVLWPHGPIGRHPRDAIVSTFESRPGKPTPIRVRDKRSYLFAELKTALARGVPDLLDAVLTCRGALCVTLELDTPRGSMGRILMAMSVDAEGQWRAHNLPFGSPDDAAAASVRMSSQTDPAAKVADKVIRKVVLGQAAELRSLRNLLMDRLWLRDQLGPAESLNDMLSRGDHRLGSAEIVFLGSRMGDIKQLSKHAPPGIPDRMKKEAPDVFGHAWHRLDPTLILTDLGALDPASGEVSHGQTSASVVLRIQDHERERTEYRVGALFI